MNIVVSSEQEILQEGETVLIKHLGPSKAARFLSAWRQGAGDYLKIREKLFEGETVDSLYDNIVEFEKANE
ncbi:MAG: hypothetical protein ABIE47_12455 [Pseudomonadota bacterium]